MATVLEPVRSTPPPPEEPGILKRPTHPTGVWSWLTTIDHKRIGILYGFTAFFFFLAGGIPNAGWFGYAPNTSITYNPGHNVDFWVFGLLILGIASTVGSVNLVTTILNMRAPGMTLMRMPIFTWMTLVSNFLILFAMPVITVALFLLMFDRNFG